MHGPKSNGQRRDRGCKVALQNTLYLSRVCLEAVYAHAAETAPGECVGLLWGQLEQPKRVTGTSKLTNVSKTPQTRFFAAPQELFTALKAADQRGQTCLGSYHSHPHSDAWPSASDLEAAPGETVQLIVGQDAVRAFRVQGGVATRLELTLQ